MWEYFERRVRVENKFYEYWMMKAQDPDIPLIDPEIDPGWGNVKWPNITKSQFTIPPEFYPVQFKHQKVKDIQQKMIYLALVSL